MTVLHASAVLAWLQEEAGTNTLDLSDSFMTAFDFAAVLDTAQQVGMDVEAVAAALTTQIVVLPIRALDAVQAAKLDPNLSIADRLSMVLAERLETTLITADSLWS